MTLSLVVLISGNGSNLQSIIDAIEAGRLKAKIDLVISNNPNAYGLERATRHNIPSLIIDHRQFQRAELFDAEVARKLEYLNPDYILLAGFMRILGSALVHQFTGRMLNIHPSLLPHYKGLNTYQRALDNQELYHGVSIHLVTAELDGGPAILQGSYSIDSGETAEDLQRKGSALEHQMYPQLLGWLSEGKSTIAGDQIFHDQILLDAPIQFGI